MSKITIGEEMMLLVLDYDTGCINYRVPYHTVRFALAGAVLTDLALAGRIDTDLDSLFLLNPAPIGEQTADRVLARIAADGGRRTVDHWLSAVGEDIDMLRSGLTDRLGERGIILRGLQDRIWIIGSRDGADADGDPFRDVRHRLAGALLGNEIPDPRDITIIGLADACDLWGELLDENALDGIRPRIDLYSRMDLIGHAVARAVHGEPVPKRAPRPVKGKQLRKDRHPRGAGSAIGLKAPSPG